MKKFLISGLLFFIVLFGLLSIPSEAEAATRVGGYYRRSGTYVQSYYRSNTNSTRWDNYSTKGNYNPYTGKKGYTNPYRTYYR